MSLTQLYVLCFPRRNLCEWSNRDRLRLRWRGCRSSLQFQGHFKQRLSNGGVVQGGPAAERRLLVPGRLRDLRDEASGLPLPDELHHQRNEEQEHLFKDL